MTTFVFTDPNGRKHTVTGPEGATQEQAFEVLQQRLGTSQIPSAPTKGPDPSEGMGWGEKALVGAGYAVDRAIRGVVGLTPYRTAYAHDRPVDDYLKQGAEDAALYQKYHPGTAATVGEIAGDAALSFGPVLGAGRVLKQTLGGLGRVVPATADIAANMGYAAATAPEDRGTAALYGGIGAGVGKVLTKTLGLGQAIKPTATAQEMMDAGLHLTPGMANSGWAGGALRRMEGLLERIPGLGAPVKNAKERLAKELESAGEHGTTMERTLLEARGAGVTYESLAKEREALVRGATPITTPELVAPGLFSLLSWYIAHPAVPGAMAAITYLGTHPVGAKVLLGQYPLQKFLTEYPQIASTLSRSISDQIQQRQQQEK